MESILGKQSSSCVNYPGHLITPTDTYRIKRYEQLNRSHSSTTTLDDYQIHDGVYLPRRSTIESEGTGRSLVHLRHVLIEVGIYEDYFEAEAIATFDSRLNAAN